jgi:hypothetical protein
LFLTEKTRRLLEETIGKSVSELSNMSYDEEIAFVTEKNGKAPVYSKKVDKRMLARGNSLMVRRRICTMEDIDKKIMEL